MNDFRKKFESASTVLPLLDVSFSTFITLSIIKIIYILLVGIETLGLVFAVITGFSRGVMAGVGGLVLMPIVWLIIVILTRMYLELIAVIFRIAHNTTMLVKAAEHAPPVD